MTITDLARKFLTSQPEPCHVDVIAKYVSKYRNCEAHNLKVYCSRARGFITIEHGYIGLASKKYDLNQWKKQNIAVLGTTGDFVEKFLSDKEDPCDIKEIAAYVLKYRKTTVDAVRAYCEHDKRFFCTSIRYFGLRSKKYDLHEWKKGNLKLSGKISLGDYAEEFLMGKADPCHIEEVANHIKKYRKINTPGKLMEILLGDKKRFVSAAPCYVGLQAKKYNLVEWKKRNIAKIGTITDLIEELLIKADVPCHQNEVTEYVSKYRVCKTEVIWKCCHNDARFIFPEWGYVALKSKNYSLEEWRKQNIGRVGTIPDIAEDYLEQQDAPCQINNILSHVRKYRNANTSAIIGRLGSDKRFIKVARGYFGLRGKEYNLAEWKKQNIGRVGTIPDIAEDYLAGQDAPCHISAIRNHIGKYFNASTTTILDRFRGDNRFIRVATGYYGLREKEYNLEEWKRQNIGRVHTIADISEDYLSKQDAPCHINSILDNMIKYRNADQATVISGLREDSRFIRVAHGYYGLREKKYNLEEWKKQNMVLVGTIPDVVEDYLARQDEPCHISSIIEHVGKYRANASNIITRLSADNRFIRIARGYYGLREKEYNLEEWGKQNTAAHRRKRSF